jgi:hypothetical protein
MLWVAAGPTIGAEDKTVVQGLVVDSGVFDKRLTLVSLVSSSFTSQSGFLINSTECRIGTDNCVVASVTAQINLPFRQELVAFGGGVITRLIHGQMFAG